MSKDKVKEAPEGEAAEGEETEEGGGKKKLPMKLLLIAGAGALVVLGGGGAAAFIFLKPKPDEAHAEKGHDKKEKKKKKEAKGGHGGGGKEDDKNAAVVSEGPDGIYYYKMPSMVVNMQTTDGRPTFLKLTLTLELPDEHVAEELNPNLPRLQDMFQTFLRELRPEDLSGSQGSYQLKMELQRRVNLIIAPARINAVLIEEQLQT